jgi:hypothetical protein
MYTIFAVRRNMAQQVRSARGANIKEPAVVRPWLGAADGPGAGPAAEGNSNADLRE